MRNRIVKGYLIVLCVMVLILSSCSNDPYANFIGIWKHGTDKIDVVKISSDGDSYFLTEDYLKEKPNEVHPLIKEQGMLVLKPKTFQVALIEKTENDDKIMIKKNNYYRISKGELTELRDTVIQKQKAPLNAAKLKAALAEFNLDSGQFPDKLEDLVVDTGNEAWMGPYLKKNEILDSWGNKYKYIVSGSNATLISFGKDGKEGGEGVNADKDFSFRVAF